MDDNVGILSVYSSAGRLWGLEVCCASSATEAFAKIQRQVPDIALVDISMPETDGVTFAGRLRAWPNCPWIVLMTGFDFPNSLLEAAAERLNVGPVFRKFQGLDALRTRIEETLAGRYGPRDPGGRPGFVRCGQLIAELDSRRVRLHQSRRLELGSRQFKLMLVFMRADHPLSIEELLSGAWSDGDNPCAVGVYISRLRHALEALPGVSIECEAGAYRLVVPSNVSFASATATVMTPMHSF
ncbi:MAG: response regulator [Elusimicrobia bacterium]|nr:response regulator [Elusimicrobiota bacterium]